MNIGLSESRYNWLPVLVLLITIYALVNLALPHSPVSGTLVNYVVQAMLWGLLIWLVLKLTHYRPAGKTRSKSSIIQLALLIGFFQIVSYVIGGVFSGFGKSPYSFIPLGILRNLVYVGSMLVGMELSRAWLINRFGKYNMVLVLGLTALLYTFISLPLTRIMMLGGNIESVRYLDSTCLPLLAENLLASFLAFLGGPIPAIAYRGILQAFQWFFPILPNPSWLFKGLVATIVPIIGVVVLQSLHFERVNPNRPRTRAKEESPAGWIATAIVGVLVIWFSLGLFAIHPTMVASGSMRPFIDVGDVVIVEKAPADAIREGDVIQFRGEKVSIMHRVVEVHETEESTFFITKGDANDAPDQVPVLPEQVIGKIIFRIPKIGWAAIVVKGFFVS